jgi:hypothetical protein
VVAHFGADLAAEYKANLVLQEVISLQEGSPELCHLIWFDLKADQGHRKVWLTAGHTGYTRRHSEGKRRRRECFT